LNNPNLRIIGVSYKKASATQRGRFGLDLFCSKQLLNEAKEKGIESIVINSTCNRVEIYALSHNSKTLISLLCKYSKASKKDFKKFGYKLKNDNAIKHIFNVGTGLDSQILGDFEIIAQMRKSFKLSKSYGLINPYFDRLFNSVTQASKKIKNETKLSSGATSVSYAAVRYILDNVENLKEKKILLFGAGKIGRNTCENLIKHTSNKQITLINRSEDKAKVIAGKFKLIVKNISEISNEIKKTDILIVATAASHPTITHKQITGSNKLLILDLSVPKNVDENLKNNPKIDLLDLDYLSNITDLNLSNRKKYIPDAQQIINDVKNDFFDWVETRKYAATVNALKNKLKKIQSNKINILKKKSPNLDEENVNEMGDYLIQKITNQVANHLKESKEFEHELKSVKTIFQINTNE
tara:strand:+ start:2395 stop:3627 length:1233 start_codon:yes stop_codon:yes gene_type:complete